MTKDNCITNRKILVDEPIVEMLLAKKYSKSGVRFTRSYNDNGSNFTCYGNGVSRSINVRRNSCKYYNSPNFSMPINKNKLDIYNNASFIFIDEVANCVYNVDGISLLSYILDHADNVRQSDSSDNFYIVMPKKDIASLSDGNVIRYNDAIAALFANSRDESMFSGLT